MKFLNLAVSAAIGLAATVASAQVPIPVAYDAYPAAGGVTYFVPPAAGNVCAGDVMRLANPPGPWNPLDTWDTVNVLFVATAPGTYNVECEYFTGYVFPNNLPCGICTTGGAPVVIPAGGAFPSVWEITFCFGATPVGANDQAVVVGTNSTAFVPAFANQAATPLGTDVPANFFTFDLNRNCVLEPGPPVNEAFSFGNPGNWNLAAQIVTTGCTPAPMFTCGNSRSVSVRPVPGMSAVKATPVPTTRINTKL